jgi:hypothetical protein
MANSADAEPNWISLSDAWLRLPPRSLIRAYNNPRAATPDDTNTALGKLRGAPDLSEGLAGFVEAMNGLQPVLDKLSARARAESDLKHWVIWSLKNGRCIAEGYPLQNGKAALVPERLPVFMFEERTALDRKVVDWKLSAIRRAGHEFIAVRVRVPGRRAGSAAVAAAAAAPPGAKNHAAAPSLRTTTSTSGLRNRPGRPRVRNQVAEVIADMIADDWVVEGPPWTDLTAEVRRRGSKTHSDVFKNDSHPDNETIRRELVAAANAEASELPTSKLPTSKL